jgi:hypothetical protein
MSCRCVKQRGFIPRRLPMGERRRTPQRASLEEKQDVVCSFTDRYPSGRLSELKLRPMSDVKILARATLACDVMRVASPQPQIAAGSGVMLPCLGCTREATFFVYTLDAHTPSRIILHTIHYHVITLTIAQAAYAYRKGFITRFTTSCARRPAVRSIPP